MTLSTLPDDLEIAPGHTVGCWKTLKLDPDMPDSADWNKAIEIFDARIRRRFLDPVDELIRFEQDRTKQTFGFAILAIDFLVIETLQGFREGIKDHNRKSKALLTNFLIRWDAFKECVPTSGDYTKLAEQVYIDYRCALHHSGATKGALRVGIKGPVFCFTSEHDIKINRTCFHEHLKREFKAYLVQLRKGDENELRRNFKSKMNAICGI